MNQKKARLERKRQEREERERMEEMENFITIKDNSTPDVEEPVQAEPEATAEPEKTADTEVSGFRIVTISVEEDGRICADFNKVLPRKILQRIKAVVLEDNIKECIKDFNNTNGYEMCRLYDLLTEVKA